MTEGGFDSPLAPLLSDPGLFVLVCFERLDFYVKRGKGTLTRIFETLRANHFIVYRECVFCFTKCSWCALCESGSSSGDQPGRIAWVFFFLGVSQRLQSFSTKTFDKQIVEVCETAHLGLSPAHAKLLCLDARRYGSSRDFDACRMVGISSCLLNYICTETTDPHTRRASLPASRQVGQRPNTTFPLSLFFRLFISLNIFAFSRFFRGFSLGGKNPDVWFTAAKTTQQQKQA